VKLLQATFFAIFLSSFAQARDQSSADLLANATFVPPPSSLKSMPSEEWCKTVDAVLANPNASPARKEEYIAVGQNHHCPHQVVMEPRTRRVQQERRPLTPQEFCAEAFKVLGNPYLDQALKAAVLEKARNRGCLD
jgi:hypothetical protein